MGTVYKAQDRELGRRVALKVIRPDMASRPEVLERFKREILLASQVTHKNVLRIHDLGEAGEVRFISMRYIEGTNLKGLLEEEGPLSLEKGLPLVRQIGEALQAAHDAGIVHRDLKPQNILIDRDGNAYIADFGISRSLAEGGTMTDTGAILGTVDYMSPEQARGETLDHRGDIYSFGVILYEMFTGTLPFRASNALSVMMKRLHEDAPSMRQARPELPAWLVAIVARAMQRNPPDRYQSAGDLLRDIERQRASRSWRRFARKRHLVPAAALLVAAAAALVVPRLPWPPWGGAAPPPPRASLVLLPFQNATGDARYDWVRSGLPSLLRSGLVQSKALRVVGDERVQEIFQALKVPEGTPPDGTTTRRIASLIGADSALGGRLLKIGGRLRIDASLQTSQPAATEMTVDGAGDEAIFGMVDELTQRVREGLGVGRGFLERQTHTTELSTKSVEALRLYGEGLALSRSGNQIDAEKRLLQTLEKDPQFAAARALLAETYDRLGYEDKAIEEANRAIAGLGSASPYEAARIRAVQARLSNDLDAAERSYRALCDIAPNDAEAFFDLASLQEERGELKAALESFRRVLVLDRKHPGAHYAVGRVLFKLGDPGAALLDFQAALALHAESGNDEGRATVLNGLGNAHYALGRYEEARRDYQDSLDLRSKIGDRRGVAVALNNIANIDRNLGRYDEAIRRLKESIAIGTEIGDRAGLAIAYSNLGDNYQGAGQSEQALQAYQESLKTAREVGDEAGLARSLANVGFINIVLGRYLEAFFFLKDSLEKRREIGDKLEIVRSLVDIGFVEQVQGRYDDALKYLLEGLTLAREVDDKPHRITLSINLSNIHEDQGNYGQALALAQEAETLARALDDATLTATSRTYLGGIRLRLGDPGGAEKALTEAMKAAKDLDNRTLLAEILTRRAALDMARGDLGRARNVAREAVAAARASRDHRLILLARLQAGELTGSAPDLQEVVKEAQSSGLAPVVATGELALARVHLAAGRAREAAQVADRAVAAAAPLRLQDVLFQSRHAAGRALKAEGKTATALDQFASALAPLEEIRRGLQGDDLQRFLARPENQTFRREAAGLFAAQGRAQEGDRLRRLFGP
jgi:tetratricopeptide (TPR) repeat protein